MFPWNVEFPITKLAVSMDTECFCSGSSLFENVGSLAYELFGRIRLASAFLNIIPSSC